jgi:hypothetical protein
MTVLARQQNRGLKTLDDDSVRIGLRKGLCRARLACHSGVPLERSHQDYPRLNFESGTREVIEPANRSDSESERSQSEVGKSTIPSQDLTELRKSPAFERDMTRL